MVLFTDTVIVVLTVSVILAALWMTYNLLSVAYAMYLVRQEERQEQLQKQQSLENAKRTKDHFRGLALEALKTPEVQNLYNALRSVPYIDSKEKEARAQNNKRKKLQAQLRKVVQDGNVRNALYDMAK